MSMTHDFLAELSWRGLLHQTTHEALGPHLSTGRRLGYVGFDPTADSLTIGNFVPIKLLMHLQRAGHVPIAVVGGGTGLIGDPSGKSAERQLLSREDVERNVAGQRRIFERLLDLSPGAGVLCDNHEWLGKLGYIEVLRDIGKHFSVNAMIARDSVRERLHNREQGMSYTEFSYMVLQAYDFLYLRRERGVTLQMGGSDQWGNIASGCDLIRRVLPPPANEAYGLTTPLVTKSDGGKFGKTESGAIWLTADRTSPYAFYQFWINTPDEDVGRFLRTFTFLPREEIDALCAEHERDPGGGAAKRALARHVTELLHGKEEREGAEAASAALFSGEVAGLPEATLREVFGAVPSTDEDRGLLAGEGMSIVEVLARTTLVKSKREAREHVQSGSISVNGVKVDADYRLTAERLLHGSMSAIRRGKKAWHLIRWR